ncbi:hypothetical protein N7539_008805 [Penicillium diatomitis]|uniref:Uncharacterized protein n=1 Tax=Penicillium diatomitis TaxID=2819901 RepID=A0A9X0BM18_9EURO|nr:uncharacterized protein N7539_008805 [Penicillium diatomitis]KAJ5471862.1 hypothetical protein N7539_008805 [Penicillium diatomitis]
MQTIDTTITAKGSNMDSGNRSHRTREGPCSRIASSLPPLITAVSLNPRANHFDISSVSDGVSPHHRGAQNKDRSRALARHIAAHSHGPMLLTLRFDNTKSDTVNVDDGANASKGTDIGRISDNDFEAGVSMDILRGGEILGTITDHVGNVAQYAFAIPDTDFSLEDVPRPCDGLAAENDTCFLKVIELEASSRGRRSPLSKSRPFLMTDN